MKYNIPKEQGRLKTEVLNISDFCYGINDDSGEIATEGDLLKDCVNMEYISKTLSTRKGFKAKEDSLVSPGVYDETVYLPLTVTDTVYFENGVPKNLAYYCTGYADAATLYFYLADGDGNISPVGDIEFNRTDAEHFYIPQNVFFIVAQQSKGNGVYAFVYRKSGDDFAFEAYEAKEDFEEWENVSNTYYVPIVLVNGRGEQYNLAQIYYGVSYPEPRKPEELNIYNGKYMCYFTSDDFSVHFRLPYGNIPLLETFSCRVYTSADSYTEWSVPPAADYATATLLGESIRLYIDRTLGVARFAKGSADYSVPRMENYGLNNIVFTSYVETDEFFEAIVSSKGAVSLNNRIYCFGGRKKRNCIFCSKSNNPFYFPVSSKLFLGDGATPVTALKVQNGKLIAFKPGEVYRVITAAENESTVTVDLPQARTYIKGDTLSAQTIDNRIGCLSADTIRLCGNRLVWLAGDGEVYALATTTYGNTTNIFRISQPLGGRLKSALALIGNAFAVTNGGQYMLFVGETVFVMNHRVRGFGYSKTYYAQDDEIKSPAWYIWKLPENRSFFSGEVVNGAPVLVSLLNDGLCFYTSVLDGKTDTHLVKENGEIECVSTPFSSGLTTKLLDCGVRHKLKSLYSLLLSSFKESLINLHISDGKRSYKKKFQTEKGFSYIPFECGIPEFRLLSLSLWSDEAMAIESLDIICKTLSGVG